MPLHPAKRTALLNSLNCVSSNDLTSLKDLSDGKCLVNILTTTFNEPSDRIVESCEFVTAPSEKDTTVNEESKTAGSVDDAAAESSVVSETEYIDVLMIESEDTNTKEEIVVQPIQSPDDVEVISQRFKLIQNFIDERYNLKSEEIVSYSKCMEANEFELAKVALFVLSELVKYFIHINNDHLRTLAHLDIRIQEDLEECFHLFISERENLSRKGVEKVLNNHAKYKSRSPKSPFATPRRNCASKYRIDSPIALTNEEVYSNSPLKSFFESPVFRKEDILLKEKEIIRARKDLVEEEFKSEEFQFQLNEAKKEIEEKDKEIKKLKATIQMQESDKKFQDYEDEHKQLQVKYDSLKKESEHKYKKYEEEISELMKQNGFLEFEAKTYRRFSHYQNLDEQDLQCELIHRDTLLEKKTDVVANYRLKQSSSFTGIDKLQNMLDAVTEELNAAKQKMKDMEIQSAKDQEIYAAKLSDLKQAIKNEPESPGLGENLGVIIEEENRILQLKLNAANLKIKQLEEKVQDVAHPENNVPISKFAFNRSILETLDLSETPKYEKRNSKKSSASVVEILDLPETPKLKKHSDKGKELTDLEVECDMSSNSEVASKNSPSSLHSDVVPFTENASEPTLEVYGSLWKNLDNSPLEIENTDIPAYISDLNRTGNCYKLLNKDLNLNVCSKCNNIPNKNGFNWNTIHLGSMKMAQELEKKEEEIDQLKASNETLQQKSVKYLEQLNEKNKEIENLKADLKTTEDNLKSVSSKYASCKQRMMSAEENFDHLNQKFIKMEIFVKKCKTSHSVEIESLKSSRRKKDKEILLLKGQVQEIGRDVNKKDQEILLLKEQVQEIGWDVNNLMSKNKSLHQRIYSLEDEKKSILKKYMETERKLLRRIKAYETIVSRESKGLETVTVVDKEGKEQSADCKSVSFYLEVNGDVSKDVNNESIVSGALYKKNGLSLNSFRMNGEDEDSFFNHTSLPCPAEKDERLDELIRRNSILPHHLQSSYPVEMNLTLNTDKFYVKNPEICENMKSENPEIDETVPSGRQSKKRKLQEPDTQNIEVVSTPVAKVRRTFKTPSSLKKLLHFSRSRRNGVVKPKP